jgi:hypothetical protein
MDATQPASPLPPGGPIRHARVLRVFEYYDRPELFAFENEANLLYLAVFAASDHESSETWIVARVDAQQLMSLSTATVDYQSLFLSPYQGEWYEVDVDLAHNTADYRLGDETLPDPTLLPEPGTRPEPQWATNLFQPEDTAEFARVFFRMDFRDPALHRVPARILGEVLKDFQSLLDLVAASLHSVNSARGRIPYHVTSMVGLDAVGFVPGSFSVVLEPRAALEPRLFDSGTDAMSEALRFITSVLSVGADGPKLRREISELTPAIRGRFSSRYGSLARSMSRVESGLELSWTARLSQGRAHIDVDTMSVLSGLMARFATDHADIIESTGSFVAVNMSNRYFSFRTTEGDVLSGRISQEVGLEPVTVTGDELLGAANYLVRLRCDVRINEVTGNEEFEYTLLEYSGVGQ